MEDWLGGQAGILLLADTIYASAVARRTLARDLAVVVALVTRLRARVRFFSFSRNVFASGPTH